MDPDSPRSPLDEGEIEDDESREFDDGLDENLMGDEEDRRRLAQMTEKEREQELFNRSEKRESAKIRFEIERKLRLKAKKREQEKRQSKQVRARKRLRASEIYSSDESSEESDEYTPDTNSRPGASNDLNSTGGRPAKMSTRSAPQIASSSSSSSPFLATSESSSSESERENDDLEASDEGQTVQDNFQMTLNDLKTLQLKRDQIDKWIYTPFFKETAIGLFVKISIGNKPITKEAVYKVAQIIDITKGTITYPVNVGINNKTDKQCLVRIGGVDRTYKMSFVSNRSFSEEDYRMWKDTLTADGRDMPSREYFNKKKRDLQKAINYIFKDEDIRYEINERKRFKEYPYNLALKKTELMGEKAEAEAVGDYEKAREIQAAIDELDRKAKELEKTRSSSTFSAISFVNERNRIKNIEESERALKESKSVKTEDPFTRRKCTPTIVHNRNNGDSLNNAANKPAEKNGQGPLSQSSNSNTNDAHNKATAAAAAAKAESAKSVDDLFVAHASIDLELDLDI